MAKECFSHGLDFSSSLQKVIPSSWREEKRNHLKPVWQFPFREEQAEGKQFVELDMGQEQ